MVCSLLIWGLLPSCGGCFQGKAQRSFTDEEDVFLVVLMHRLGYGNWERIRMEIRKVRTPLLSRLHTPTTSGSSKH